MGRIPNLELRRGSFILRDACEAMSKKWYICWVEPKRSLELVEQLSASKDVECPSFTFRRRVPRRKRVEVLRKPLIGGIFFCGVGSWPLGRGLVAGVELSELRRMPGADGSPAVVGDEEIEPLRDSAIIETAERTNLNAGDEVELMVGPFKGKRARVRALEDDDEIAQLEVDWLPGLLKIRACLLRKIAR